MNVSNLTLWVQENTTSEKFYKRLGFKVNTSYDTYSVVSLGNFKIVLISMRDEQEFAKDSMSSEKGRGSYLYVDVENVDRVYQELVSKKLSPVSKPRDWPWGNREFVIKDPDGYKICFSQTKINE